MDINQLFEDTLSYLFDKLPMFSRIGKAALKPDLTNTLKLCEALGNPQHKFKSIHIAGTNGKGSTSHALAAVLQGEGYKTGLYTSPHLVDFRERIRVNGEMVDKAWVVQFTEQLKPVIEEIQPSFFEITVAMAFEYFAQQQVDIAVIETGLGGRLDSTNVITPLLSIITNISYDHKDLLGHILDAIAGEKAGIMKTDVPCIVGEQHPETEKVFFDRSVHVKAPLYYAENYWDLVKVGGTAFIQSFRAFRMGDKALFDVETDLNGSYQKQNLKTILTAIELLPHSGIPVDFNRALAALKEVKRSTGLRGRWDVVSDNPITICDVGHNEAGIKEIFSQISQVEAKNKLIVTGFVRDKDVSEVLKLFPKDAKYFLCNAKIPRAMPVDELYGLVTEVGLNAQKYTSVAEAYTAAKAAAISEDVILVTGSFFIVGEFLECVEAKER